MATFVASSVHATTPALPAGAAIGDGIYVFAYRDGNATPPTLPADWITVITRPTTPALLIAWRPRDSAWTMPVFTNATRCVAVAVRPASGKIVRPGVNAVQGGTSTSVAWAVQTLQVNDGTSVILRGFAHARPDATPGTPANHTLIDANGTRPGFGTYRKTTTTDMAAGSLTVSRSDVWSSGQVEIRDAIPPNYGSGGTVNHDWTTAASGVAPAGFAVTQAAYRFYDDAGTESGASALAAQDTPITGILTNGDGYGSLRVRLQSTSTRDLLATDDWQLQWEKNANGTWVDVSATEIAQSYRTPDGGESYLWLYSLQVATGQSFLGNGNNLSLARFKVNKQGAPNGNNFAVLYAHSGTYGSSSVGTGSPLATSVNSIPSSAISTTDIWYDFLFDGTFKLENGVPYVIAFQTTNSQTTNANALQPKHALLGTLPGNRSSFLSGGTVWNASSNEDLLFEIETTSSNAVIPYNDPNLTDGASTTNRLTGGSGTFIPGKVSKDGLVDDFGFTGNNHTELLYPLKLIASKLADGDTLRFRVLRNGFTTPMTYSVTPTINITNLSVPPNVGSSAVSHSWSSTASGTKPAVPKIATLIDTFDTTVDPAKWPTANFVTWEAGQAKILSNVDYDGLLTSATAYDLQESSIFAKVTPPSSALGGEFRMLVRNTPANWVGFYLFNNVLYAEHRLEFDIIDVSNVTYNATNHAWWKVSESGGTIFWHTSSDGVTWNLLTSESVVNILSPVCLFIDTGGEASPDYAYVDNVNTGGAAPPNSGSAAVTWSESASATGKETPKGSATSNYTWTTTASGVSPAVPTGLSLVAYKKSPATPVNAATYAIPGISWAAGDRIIVFSMSEDSVGTIGAPTNANLTFSAITQASSNTYVGSESNMHTWQATAASAQTGQTVTINRTGSGEIGGIVYVIHGTIANIVNTSWNRTESPFSLTVLQNSIVLYGAAEWNLAPIGRAPLAGSGTVTNRLDVLGTAFGTHAYDYVGVSAGTFSFGCSNYTSPTAWKVTHAVLEITSGGGPSTPSGSATFNYAYTQTASGTKPILPVKQGDAAVTWTYSVTALGKETPKGSTTVNHSWDDLASGKKFQKGTATTTHTWTNTASGKKAPVGSATVSHTWTNTASGVKPIVGVKQGTANVTWSVTTAATGKTTPKGSATTAHFWALSASGTKLLRGNAAVTHSWTNTAVGKKAPKGSAVTTHTWATASSGAKQPKGSAAVTHTWTNTAIGIKPVVGMKQGTAAVTWATTTLSSGKRAPKAGTTVSHSWTNTASGTKPPKGSAATSYTFATLATGKRVAKSSVTVTNVWALASTGKRTPKGAAPVTHTWTQTAIGIKPVVGMKQGTANVTYSFATLATGKRVPKASSTTTHTWVLTATGKKTLRGNSVVTYTFSPIGTGKKVPKANGAVTYTFALLATGRKIQKGTTSVQHSWSSVAIGVKPAILLKQGSAVVVYSWSTAAIGKKLQNGSGNVVWVEAITATGKRNQRGTASITWNEVVYVKGNQTATILNLAKSLYLGETLVQAVYVGSQKVWPVS